MLAELSGFFPASSQQEEVEEKGEVMVMVSADGGHLTLRGVTVDLSEASDADTDLESLQPQRRPKREPLLFLLVAGNILSPRYLLRRP